jgi:DNA-binding NarL/FixJ family response regulator
VAQPNIARVNTSVGLRDRARIRVANTIRAAGLRDRLDRLVRELSWAELCPAGIPATDLLFADAGGAATEPAGWCAVVAVLGRADGGLLDAAVRSGARGLILADDPIEDFRRAIHDVIRCGGWISPRLASQLLARFPAEFPVADPATLLTPLTERERQALRLLAEGRENAEIAATMSVSVSAVKYHVSNILRKFGCRDRAQLVAYLNRAGLHAGHL